MRPPAQRFIWWKVEATPASFVEPSECLNEARAKGEDLFVSRSFSALERSVTSSRLLPPTGGGGRMSVRLS